MMQTLYLGSNRLFCASCDAIAACFPFSVFCLVLSNNVVIIHYRFVKCNNFFVYFYVFLFFIDKFMDSY